MKVLMLGWEFPPFISGGLGTACHGLTKGMSQIGVDVTFLLPKPVAQEQTEHVRLVSPASQRKSKPGVSYGSAEIFGIEGLKHVTFCLLEAGGFSSYATPEQTVAHQEAAVRATQQIAAQRAELLASIPGFAWDMPEAIKCNGSPEPAGGHYDGDMFVEINRYARLAMHVAMDEDFDIIHAHDWMTYRAGIAVAAMTGKPLVVHIHSTEFDRSGEHVNQRIYDIERAGLHYATRVIAVSMLTKNIVTTRYGVDPAKVDVVYNAIEFNGFNIPGSPQNISKDEKIVLFLGRITMQKGPDYFLAAAKKVLEVMSNVRFIMAGSGDMIHHVITRAAEMGIADKVLFTGFLRGRDVEHVFQMADLYVMPSVSEPFGIAPLEALSNNTPVIISKQSGVSEVLTHALKVDFWDVDEMANKIVAVLRHAPLQSTLRQYGSIEVRKMSWVDSAQNCVEVYRHALQQAATAAAR